MNDDVIERLDEGPFGPGWYYWRRAVWEGPFDSRDACIEAMENDEEVGVMF